MSFLLVVAFVLCVLFLYFMVFGTVFDEEKSALYNFGVPVLVVLVIIVSIIFVERALGL